MADSESPARQCHCVIAHPTSDAEREEVVNALAYARSVNDPQGVLLQLARLTGARSCPANAPRP